MGLLILEAVVQLPSLAWLGCESQAKTNGCSFLSERVGVNSSMESISPVIFLLELELLSLKVKVKPEEPPPSCHDGEVHATCCRCVCRARSVGVATAVFVVAY